MSSHASISVRKRNGNSKSQTAYSLFIRRTNENVLGWTYVVYDICSLTLSLQKWNSNILLLVLYWFVDSLIFYASIKNLWILALRNNENPVNHCQPTSAKNVQEIGGLFRNEPAFPGMQCAAGQNVQELDSIARRSFKNRWYVTSCS